MGKFGHLSRARWLAVLCAVAIVGSACGDDSDADTSATSTSVSVGSTATPATTPPKTGGSVRFGQLAALAGLDPSSAIGNGNTGGNELAAVYDTIVRYNPDTKKYVPQTGSLEPNADFTEWTLKLKPNIKFSDGTAYDTAAVKFNIDRLMAPGSRSSSLFIMQSFLDTTTIVDAQTMRFKLKMAWTGFPYPFTREVGMIASPAAIQKAGTNFAVAPGDAGAGPFVVSSFKPSEELVLKRNPNYWNGPVYLDELRFSPFTDPSNAEIALESGTLQGAVIRDPIALAKAVDKGFNAIGPNQPGGSMAVFNSGLEVTCAAGKPAKWCDGKPDATKVKTISPATDARVRKAVWLAVDTTVLNDRVYQGKALTGTEIFQKSYPYYPNVPGPKVDLVEARRLVNEVKATGWDGKIRLLTANDPTATAWGQTIATAMRSVGMDVTYDSSKDQTAVVDQMLVQRDFDVASFGMGLLDEADNNYAQLLISVVQPRYGYSSSDMTAAVDKLRIASTEADYVAAHKTIAEIWNRDVPSAFFAAIAQRFVYSKSLQGVTRGSSFLTFFDKASLA